MGNYGLRDQRRAFEWVHGFISCFGGDPNNVTVFGLGSGAADILCHMHSAANETRPLFQRAIVQSPVLDSDVPNVSAAGWQVNKLMCAFQARSMEDLRSIPVEKLVAYTPHFRAVDDGVFFAKGWREALYPEQPDLTRDHHKVPELQLHAHRLKTRSSRSSLTGQSRSQSRSRSRARHNHNTNLYHHSGHLQPMMVGDCGAESLAWSGPAALWSAPGVVRRIRAICQSMSKSTALLRAYDISSHTPSDELPDHVLDLINDARFAWPTECIASTAKRARGGQGVWRYVFDQESPSKGTPHHAVDILYLFDNVPLTVPSSASPPAAFSPEPSPCNSLSPSPPATPPLSYGSDSDSEGAVDFGFGFTTEDDEWGVPIVDEWTYGRVRDAVQGRWLAFAYGEAPWSEEKVYVFGPEGETGERSMNIFAGRRRLGAWKDALEPLGMQLVQKVGIELSNGPPLPTKS